MRTALSDWMTIAITVIVIVALVWGAAVNKVEDKQGDLDTTIESRFQVPTVTGQCTGC